MEHYTLVSKNTRGRRLLNYLYIISQKKKQVIKRRKKKQSPVSLLGTVHFTLYGKNGLFKISSTMLHNINFHKPNVKIKTFKRKNNPGTIFTSLGDAKYITVNFSCAVLILFPL